MDNNVSQKGNQGRMRPWVETVEKNAPPLVDAAYSYVDDYEHTEEFFLKGKRAEVELKKNEE